MGQWLHRDTCNDTCQINDVKAIIPTMLTCQQGIGRLDEYVMERAWIYGNKRIWNGHVVGVVWCEMKEVKLYFCIIYLAIQFMLWVFWVEGTKCRTMEHTFTFWVTCTLLLLVHLPSHHKLCAIWPLGRQSLPHCLIFEMWSKGSRLPLRLLWEVGLLVARACSHLGDLVRILEDVE